MGSIIMYVSNTFGVGKTAAPNKSKKHAATGGNFAAFLGAADASSGAVGMQASQDIASMNPLFMLQEVDGDRPSAKQRMIEGFDALEYLERVHLSLLEGKVPLEVLKNLQTMTQQWNNPTNDPRLDSIIESIQVRAAVEIAKLGL